MKRPSELPCTSPLKTPCVLSYLNMYLHDRHYQLRAVMLHALAEAERNCLKRPNILDRWQGHQDSRNVVILDERVIDGNHLHTRL